MSYDTDMTAPEDEALHCAASGNYVPPRPIVVRPGSMDAFAKPSRRGDALEQYKPPYVLGSRVPHPRVDR